MGNHVLCSSSMCPKASLQPVADHELFDDTGACDPAGTMFNETLEELNEVDRLLLLFSSSTNIAAVRWLCLLGASTDACDTNGTTCLHGACRAGSLAIVRELIAHRVPLDVVDTAGWTPLHVALFMGRRAVALELLQHRADMSIPNSHGLLAVDLCSDVWLREAVAACDAHRHGEMAERRWECDNVGGLAEDLQVSARLRFEPFFVPRAAALRDMKNATALQQVGVEIFNQRPGQGLAFLVSTGSVRDFPVELSSFLSEHKVSLVQVGEFLGEDFSLSQTLRLECINAVRLMGLGVVAALAKVFKQFRIPSDMQKIDRLTDGIAQIWWRQHEQLREKDFHPREDDQAVQDGEVDGLRLMRHFSSYDELHQLMFSAIMLHWNLYAPLPPSQRVTHEEWLSMNGLASLPLGETRLESPTTAALRQVFSCVYHALSKAFFPQLQIWSDQPGGGAPDSSRTPSPAAPPISSRHEEFEGWAFLVGGGFPAFAGSSSNITYRHVRSILSETTTQAFSLVSPNVSRQQETVASRRRPDLSTGSVVGVTTQSALSHPSGDLGQQVPPPASGEVVVPSSRQDWVWLSVRTGLLFLAPKQNDWAPYVYVNLGDAVVQNVDRASLIISIVASNSTNSKPAAGIQARALPGLRRDMSSDSNVLSQQDGPQLQLVFLLPDGRWQILEIPSLQVQVPDARQLDRWRASLEVHCRMADAGGVIPEHPKREADDISEAIGPGSQFAEHAEL